MQFASDELRNDKEVVMAAIQQNKDALLYAYQELQKELKDFQEKKNCEI